VIGHTGFESQNTCD